jgi:EAL domain-containing protein (putative c-di-GMP-specific phosphodiesterase class I)/GGDEF domain-containing protein
MEVARRAMAGIFGARIGLASRNRVPPRDMIAGNQVPQPMPNEQLSENLQPPDGDSLIDSLPDLVVLVRRDGIILDHGGGRSVFHLKMNRESNGKGLAHVWPQAVADLVIRLLRRAITLRASTEAAFEDDGRQYEARLNAHGSDRALCVIRAAPAGGREELDLAGERLRPRLDRRGFLRRFDDAVSLATLREKPAAVAVIHIEGAAAIAQSMDAQIAEQIMNIAILRMPGSWFLGQLSDTAVALILETSDRDSIEASIADLCANLREPILLGDASFRLTPFAGVAILGQDANSAKILLDQARAAAGEAQRRGSANACFFTDTVQLRSLARLDTARELREAIENREVRLRYAGRHDLATGRLVSWVGYLRWIHPIRGEVRPIEFLRIAESTGLATALSRAALCCLQEDFGALAARWEADVRISFGAMRHHVLHEDFAGDIANLLASGTLPAQRLELRIAEKTFIACDPAALERLRHLGVRLVVDEVGRGFASLDGLARAPIWGLQLDRAWVTALRSDAVALKVCRAGISLAGALGLIPIATGIDDEWQREQLRALGCGQGSGDIFRNAVPDVMQPYQATVFD